MYGRKVKTWLRKRKAPVVVQPEPSIEPTAEPAIETVEPTPEPERHWQPGWVFTPEQSWEEYREILLGELAAEDDTVPAARAIIEAEIARAPETEHRHLAAHLVRHLQTFSIAPDGPGVMLDVGGPSLYGLPLAELKNWKIETIEILAIDYERDPLPLQDASVDMVSLCEVIEHFTFDPLFCLSEINRVLHPGGHLVITTPNSASWFAIYQALQQKPGNRWPVYAAHDAPNRENHIHAREYLTSEMRTLLEAAGFEVEALTTRDYGISAAFVPIPGYPHEDRGETIFCRARKIGAPTMRCVRPIYLEDRPAR